MSDKHIKRYTALELAEMRARGEVRTDFQRIADKTEEELERDIASDPDTEALGPDWFEHAELVMPAPKKLLSLRLDEDVIEWFRSRGPGYQTRMNAVLRAFVQQAEKRASRRLR